MVRLLRLFVLALALMACRPALAGELRVYFFDVGQGDSALIVSPTGKTVLIDAGPPEAGARLKGRLEQLLHAPLDLAILTHPHLDHLGGMVQALDARGVMLFMDSGFAHPSPGYDSLLRYLEAHQVRVVNAAAGRSVDLGGGAQLSLLAPVQPFFQGTRSDPNANSVIARLTFGQTRFLFAADAEDETERALLSRSELQSDVLKVAHHGSRYSSSEAFLRAVAPKIAVVSVGAGNDYGHPARAALDRLEAVGAKVYRTDLDGEVRIVSDGEHLAVRTGAEAAPPPSAPAPEPVAQPAPPPPHPRSRPAHVEAPAPAPAPVSKPAPSAGAAFVGSVNSKVFHKPDCHNADRIKPENRVTFATRQEALAAGRTPAKDCNP